MTAALLVAEAARIPLAASAFWGADVDFDVIAGSSHALLHLLFSLGLTGMFLVSIVDSSFVPLPIPGMTDIMLVVYAAQHANPWLLIAIATTGSALGGLFSHKVGQAGGLAFIEKRTPPRIFKRVTGWMESHAILAVALPAILPPPMPLSPFVLAAGALKMSRKKFMITFTISRLIPPFHCSVARRPLRQKRAGSVAKAIGDVGYDRPCHPLDRNRDHGRLCDVAAVEDEPQRRRDEEDRR